MAKTADFVKESTATTGVGTYTLSGVAAAGGFRTFASAFTNGDVVEYAVTDGVNREVGTGVYSAGTLTRGTILSSTNAGAAVNWSAGDKTIWANISANKVDQVVELTGNQTVAGVKTFASLPVLPASSPAGLQAASAFAAFRKNALINGDFQIWPEGTSFAAIANNTYFAEMWQYIKVGAMVHTVSQSSDVPTIAEAGRKIPFSVLVDCTTVDAAIAAGDLCMLATYVEGSNFVYIAGVGLCHQFWCKHTKTGTYCVAYVNSGSDRSFVREYTQNVSDTWEFKSVLVDASPTAGTWDYTTGIGLRTFFALATGSTYQTAAGAWQVGNFFATANQVNACDSTANNFRLAGVQLEKGSVATEFEAMKIQDVEALCQYYFEKSFVRGKTPVQNAGINTGETRFWSALGGAITLNFTEKFAVPKRTVPTMVLYNPSVANAEIRNASAGDDTGSATNPTTRTVDFSCTQNAGSGAGQVHCVHWTANARF